MAVSFAFFTLFFMVMLRVVGKGYQSTTMSALITSAYPYLYVGLATLLVAIVLNIKGSSKK